MNRLRGGSRSLAQAATGSLAIAAVLLALEAGAASAQQAGVRVGPLDCAASPEVVTITNTGQETSVLAGWKLVSDPPDVEVFDLSSVGALSPGETVYIQSGPGAGGAFVWSTQSVLRDGDPTEFVRLVDAAGSAVQEVRCASSAATPPPAPVVPDGGGPPSAANAARVPALVTSLGGLLMAFGALAVIVSIARSAPGALTPQPAGARPAPPIEAPSLRLQPLPTAARRGGAPGRPYVLAAAAGVAAAALLALVLGSRRLRR